jgi:Na+/proline symporter
MMSYARFAAMIVTSTLVMFGLMYLNPYALDNVEFSQTRLWMALVMGAAMALIMLGFMWSMYKNRAANFGIIAGIIAVFALALWLVRSQETVGDVAWMKAMIPHHSIAIMTSERAHIKDPEVRKLADGIIDAQVREIAEMKRHIARLAANLTPENAPDIPSYRDRHAPPPTPETDASAGVNTLAAE